MDYELARKNMLDCQLRPNRITAAAVLSAFEAIPREKFVTESARRLSYLDETLPLSEDRYLMSPCTTAQLLQALELDKHKLALIVACGSGYEVALAARMADMVIGLEENDDMIAASTIHLAELNIDNAEIAAGDLRLGVPAEAPFDAILLCGAAEEVSDELKAQLSDDGKLAYVYMAEGAHMGEARLITRKRDSMAERTLFDAYAKPLKSFCKSKSFSF